MINIRNAVAARAVVSGTLCLEAKSSTLSSSDSLGSLEITVARDQSDKISLGQNADQASIFDHRKTADLSLGQESCGLDQGSIRAGRDHLGGHHIFDRESVENLPLSVLAIAKRLRERVAKEIALGHDADEGLTVIIDDRANGEPAPGA